MEVIHSQVFPAFLEEDSPVAVEEAGKERNRYEIFGSANSRQKR